MSRNGLFFIHGLIPPPEPLPMFGPGLLLKTQGIFCSIFQLINVPKLNTAFVSIPVILTEIRGMNEASRLTKDFSVIIAS